MRKPIRQPSFATLTEAELDQIVAWLRCETYETVRQRVNKPRPEGFGLNISDKPLQTLHRKMGELDLINARLSAGKKLTLADLDTIRSASLHQQPDIDPASVNDVHQAIFDATHELVTAGHNSPTQLLSLQRLTDFPARLALRAQQAEFQAHKIEMDLHRVHLNLERLDLEKRRLALKESAAKQKTATQPVTTGTADQNDPNHRPGDHLGPYARNREELRARVRAQFGYFRRPEPAPPQPAAITPTAPAPANTVDLAPNLSPLSPTNIYESAYSPSR